MYCSFVCVWPPAWAYWRSSARKRLRPSASCLTAACVQPLAASRTWSAASAAKAADTIRRKRAAARSMVVLLRFPEFFDEIGLAAHIGQAEIAAEVGVC